MTLLERARTGEITDEMKRVAEAEHAAAEDIRQRMAEGRLVIPCNQRRRAQRICAIGEGTRTKVNANIGSSHDFPNVETELEKLEAAAEAGADTVMDLSTGGDITAIRERILDASPVGIGTVPIYEAAIRAARETHRGIRSMTADNMLQAVREHCEQGVDFVTLHCGVTRDVVRSLKTQGRVCGIVSRGGTFLPTGCGSTNRRTRSMNATTRSSTWPASST